MTINMIHLGIEENKLSLSLSLTHTRQDGMTTALRAYCCFFVAVDICINLSF